MRCSHDASPELQARASLARELARFDFAGFLPSPARRRRLLGEL
jgi:hypothetical protein